MLPQTLRLFNVFVDGTMYIDQCIELKLPKIATKTEDYQGAGMLAPVKLIKGLEPIEIEHTYTAPPA